MIKTRLTDGWKVYRDKDAFSLVYTLPADAADVSVPYDAMWHEPQDQYAVSAGRTCYLDGGVYHYYKELDVPESMRGEKLILRFDGVFSKSYVYLNGSQVGQGDFGYIGYDCDITDYVRYGGKNILLVVGKTAALSSRWYSGGGICKDVWLLEGKNAYITPGSFYLDTLEITDRGPVVNLCAQVTSMEAFAQDLTIRLTVTGEEGYTFCRTFLMRVHAAGTGELTHRVLLDGALAWSEDAPHRYNCRLEVLRGDEVLDSEDLCTGFRTLSWDAARGLSVNGKTVKLRGGCVHHDEGMLGGVSYYDFEYRRIKRMKEAGFNAIRSAHNHAAPALLDACDALGVFVLDEVCDMWTKMKGYEDYTQYFSSSWKKTVKAMVEDDRRHPCVVGYSTGNEISDICTEKGIETSHEIYHYFKELDGTRFVTNGINGAFAAGDGLLKIASDLTGQDESAFADGDVNKFMFLMATQMGNIVRHPVISGILEQLDSSMDVMGYNYMTSRYAPDAVSYPDRLMLGTETYPKQIAENWRNITAIPQCIGDFTWTGWNYTGELGETPDNYPAWNNESGDLDTTGARKPVSYYREIVFGLRTAPYICVRPPQSFGVPRQFGPWKFTDAVESWSFAQEEFTENNPEHILEVEVYSPAAEVELFLNGRSLGRKQTGDAADDYAIFEVPYERGVLKAVNCGDGRSESTVLESAGDVESMVLAAETGSPLKYSEGLIFVNIGFEDEKGRKVFGAGETLTIECEGVQILAFGSTGQTHRAGFTEPEIRFEGSNALAILKKTGTVGRVKITCRENGLSAEYSL